MQKIYVVDLNGEDREVISEISEINSILAKGGEVVSVTAIPKTTGSDYFVGGDVIIVIEI